MGLFGSAFVIVEGDFAAFVVATAKPIFTLRFIGAY
jgi:hypothetical protein